MLCKSDSSAIVYDIVMNSDRYEQINYYLKIICKNIGITSYDIKYQI